MAVLDAPQAQRANRKYFRSMMTVPLLSKERELDLATRWRQDRDERALHELINAYMRLALSVASKYRHYGLPISDLVQEGMLGLMQAAKRFDPKRDVRFATYATWWIRAAVQDFVLRNWSIVRTGTTAAQKKLFFNLKRLRAQLNISPNAPLTTEQQSLIAQQLRIAGKDVTAMSARLSHNDRSLNATVFGENEDEWQDFLEDSRPDPEQNSFAENCRDYRNRWLGEALATLSEREQIIIRERRLAEKHATLENLGQRLGLSKERVRQIETQALGKMRAFIALNVGDPVESGLIG